MLNLKYDLPPEQYGFIPGKATTTPIGKIITDIKSEISVTRGKMYACFVDFEKAFDNVDRNLLNKKLTQNFNLGGKMLTLINNIIQNNNIFVSVNNQNPKQIVQTKGVAQGDTLSPTLFLMYIADLPHEIIQDTDHLKILMYADDLVLYSTSPKEINIALENLSIYCDTNKLKVNLGKTKIIKFRKGGRLSKEDNFEFKNKKVDIVNIYTYLGVTLQTKLTFTEHIRNRKIQAIRAINSLKNLQRLTIENAHILFKQKIKPIADYALKQISPLLSTNQLHELDKIKTYFAKRVLGVHKSASSTLCLHMLKWHTLIEDLRDECSFNLDELKKYDEMREEKNWLFVTKNYSEGPAFISTSWKKANQNNRSKICRITVHGFHHLICKLQQNFHEPSEECVCKYCQENCENRYHILSCVNALQACDIK